MWRLIMTQDYILLLVILTAIILVILLKKLNTNRSFSGRESVELCISYKDKALGLVKFDTYAKLMKAVGLAFNVNSKLLRSSDTLDDLYSIDSWDLGEGMEVLNKLIEKNFNITSLRKEPNNLLELMIEIESQQKLDKDDNNN